VNTTTVHPLFELVCVQFLAIDRRTTKRLWATLYPTEISAFILQTEFYCRAPSPEGFIQLTRRLSPQLLLTACRRLAPEDGGVRDRAVTASEEKILARAGQDGQWV
jgi:hypothetical protein